MGLLPVSAWAVKSGWLRLPPTSRWEREAAWNGRFRPVECRELLPITSYPTSPPPRKIDLTTRW